MISATIRNVIRCCWWLAITAIVLVAAAWSVLEHYLNAANALELLGTEQKPLSADSLLGTVLSAFLPQAALPQAMALTISLIEALAFFFIANTLMDILGLIRHYRTSRKHDQPEEAEEAVWRLIENGFGMAMLGGLLVYGILWDLDIFRGGLAFLDTKLGLRKWMNCSIVTAMRPIERSRRHETVTQEPLIEVQGPGRPGGVARRGNARRAGLTARRACHPDRRLAQAAA